MLMEELRLSDVQSFKNFTRMQPEMFFALLHKLEPRISKQDTWWREAISPGVRLALTLRFFATGDSYMSLSYNWRVAHNTISKIVREVSEAIIHEYTDEFLCPPITTDRWLSIAENFSTRWNFEHALGALDGKHVAIKCPKKSGSIYYNYKGFYSIVLMALVDADYNFIWVDAGCNGSGSDAQIWNSCELKELIEEKLMGMPEAAPIVEGQRDVPYFIIGDAAFALRTYMMKPHSKRNFTRPERIFNYRLSRARRIVENAFGILTNRFRCLLTTMRQTPQTVTSIVLACCCLHNLLRNDNPNHYSVSVDEEDDRHNVIPGAWRAGHVLADGERQVARNTGTQEGKLLRNYLTQYYSSPEGSVEWQDRMIV